MDHHRSEKAARDTPGRRKRRQHAASLAVGVIMFAASLGLMQAISPPAPPVPAAATGGAPSAAQASRPLPPSSSGVSNTGETSAGAGENETIPASGNGRGAPPPAPTVAEQVMGLPSVYIHVLDENARARARLLAPALERKGIALAGVRMVSDGPRASDLRYFRPSERQEAVQVQAALLSLGLPARRLKRISGFETSATPRQYELWLSADYKG